MMIQIREETEADQKDVYLVNSAAFDTNAEAGLVDALRKKARPFVSLVAEVQGKIAGHIMFSPVTLSGCPGIQIMGLAPMAVLPESQRQGIGSSLVQAGVKACAEQGVVGLVVLGHPAYYPKFGFVPSTRYGIECEYEVPADAFMVMEVEPNAFRDKAGTIKYHQVFSEL